MLSLTQTACPLVQRKQNAAQPLSNDFLTEYLPRYSVLFCVQSPVEQLGNTETNSKPTNYSETNKSSFGDDGGPQTTFYLDGSDPRPTTSTDAVEALSTCDQSLNQTNSFHMLNERQNFTVAHTRSNVSSNSNHIDSFLDFDNVTIIVPSNGDQILSGSKDHTSHTPSSTVTNSSISDKRNQTNNVSSANYSQSSTVLPKLADKDYMDTSLVKSRTVYRGTALVQSSEHNVDVTYVF